MVNHRSIVLSSVLTWNCKTLKVKSGGNVIRAWKRNRVDQQLCIIGLINSKSNAFMKDNLKYMLIM